jgi:FtsP/CotA-like multicopper oxidase with cupredoxin domain
MLLDALARGLLAATLAAIALAAAAAPPKVLSFAVANGAVAGLDADTVAVRQGDDLELRWTSDRPMELHLHGYDIEKKVSPGAPAVMAFKASIPGRFPVEQHGQGPGRHKPVLYLEVRP